MNRPHASALLAFALVALAPRLPAENPPHSVASATAPKTASTYLDDPAHLLPPDAAWLAAQNQKLAAFERATGIKFFLHFHPKSPSPEEDSAPGVYMRTFSKKLGTAQKGIVAVYFADEDDWRVWLGDDLTARFAGKPGTAAELTTSGAIHDVKEALLTEAKSASDAAFAALQKAAPAGQPPANAQRIRLQTEAVTDRLLARMTAR